MGVYLSDLERGSRDFGSRGPFRQPRPVPHDVAFSGGRGSEGLEPHPNSRRRGEQPGRALRQETGLVLPYRVRKFDGEPFSPEPLAAAVRNCLAPGGPPVQTLVSSELDIPGRHS